MCMRDLKLLQYKAIKTLWDTILQKQEEQSHFIQRAWQLLEAISKILLAQKNPRKPWFSNEKYNSFLGLVVAKKIDKKL